MTSAPGKHESVAKKSLDEIKKLAKSAGKKAEKKQREDAALAAAHQKRQDYLDGDVVAHEAYLVKDMLRIADDPANPYQGTCSRARYRKHGYFPEEVVFDLFGNHAEFQRAAGLRDSRSTTAFKNRRARLKTEERIQEYFRAEVLPWVGAYDRVQDEQHIRMLVGSDFHGHEVDRFALEVFIDVAKRIQPEVVVLNGDVFDFYEVGRWTKNPNRLLDLQGEIDWTVEHIFKPIREAAPHAQIDLVIGNHEYRLCRYIADVASGLASLRCLNFGELLSLKEHRIGLVHNDAILAPGGKEQSSEYKQTWKTYGGCFTVTHGRFGGPTPAAKELQSMGGSGTSGHVHAPSYHCKPNDRQQWQDWMITPMMAQRGSHGREFVQGPSTWLTGFGYVDIFPDRGVSMSQLVISKDDTICFGGQIYRKTLAQ